MVVYRCVISRSRHWFKTNRRIQIKGILNKAANGTSNLLLMIIAPWSCHISSALSFFVRLKGSEQSMGHLHVVSAENRCPSKSSSLGFTLLFSKIRKWTVWPLVVFSVVSLVFN